MKQLITKFYSAFKNLDADTMVDCYHDDIEFTDPAFGKLRGEHAKNMWRMLCQNAQNFKLEFSEVNAGHEFGSALWEAKYIFSQTGNEVHNKIKAKFEFKDGLIIKHTDDFNLHTWAKQALGFKGWLLGNTSFFKNKLNQQTARLLEKFEQKQT